MKIVILILVGLASFFVLPEVLPFLREVAFRLAGVGIQYVHLITLGLLAMTFKALG